MKVYVLIAYVLITNGDFLGDFFAGEVWVSEEAAYERVDYLNSTLSVTDQKYVYYAVQEVELNTANGPVRERK